MKTDVKEIEVLCRERIQLFQKLLDCVTTEKDSLVELNVNKLWSLMEEKQGIIESLEKSRNRISELIDLDDPYPYVPAKDKKAFMGFFQKIEQLKNEIRQKVKENVSITQDSLDFFQDLVSVFTSAGRTGGTYSPVKGPAPESTNILYYREA